MKDGLGILVEPSIKCGSKDFSINRYVNPEWIKYQTIRKATQEEIQWLKTCEKEGKFIPKEQALKKEMFWSAPEEIDPPKPVEKHELSRTGNYFKKIKQSVKEEKMSRKVKQALTRDDVTLIVYDDDSKLLIGSDGEQAEFTSDFGVEHFGFGQTRKQKCASFAWKSTKFLANWCIKKPIMTFAIGPAWEYTKRVPYMTFPLVIGSSIYAYFQPEHSMEMLTQAAQYLKNMVS